MEIQIPFSHRDKKDLAEFRSTGSVKNALKIERHVVKLPIVKASTEKEKKIIEEAVAMGRKPKRDSATGMPPEVIEAAKATFTATGGNISQVASLHDLTPESVIRLANQEEWPLYSGSVTHQESRSKAQLNALQKKLWIRIEDMLDAMEVETKEKEDISQHRINSKYIEPLSSRSGAFKSLMDQYMRVSTILEPEIFSEDPDPSNYRAVQARSSASNVKEVNREIADFFSQVVVGIADRISDKETEGYGNIIDSRAE